MTTLAHRSPRLVRIVAREVSGGFEIIPVIFVPFVLAGLGWVSLVLAIMAARRAWQVVKPVYVWSWVNWWIVKAAVTPLEHNE